MLKLTMTQEMIKRQLEEIIEDTQQQHLIRAFTEPDSVIPNYYIFSEGCFYTRSYYHKYYANKNIIAGDYPYKIEVYRVTENFKTVWEL